MLSLIVDARARPEGLPPLLAQLTSGAVEGLVREVIVVGRREGVIDWVCEDMGAEAEPTLAAALERAKGQLVLALPAEFRFREGWVERLRSFLAEGGKAAEFRGLGGWLSTPRGVLVERGRALSLQAADLQQLRHRVRLRRRLY